MAVGKPGPNAAATTVVQNSVKPSSASAGIAPTNAAPSSAAVSPSVSHSIPSEAAASKPESSGAQNQIVAAVVAPSVAAAVPSAPLAQHAAATDNVAPIETEKKSATQPSNAAKPAEMTRVSKRAIIRPPVESNTVAVSDAGNAAGFSAPKLVKALRPNSPAEALQGFISGNVLLDALVDPTGHVKSSKIISGPEKLRRAALDAIQQYKYEPAMQNGKPIPAHVKVTIQFWYEP
jgi:protein TonB